MERSLQVELSETEKRDALQRVLASSTFHRSDQLKSLLRYVCEREIQGAGETLSEYTVAIEALGRRRDYSALEDGSVRNRIHTLRRRLEHYYEVENPGDLLRIDLPKGTYCPSFLKRPAIQVVLHSTSEPASAPAPLRPSGFWDQRIRLSTVSIFAAVVLAIAIVAVALAMYRPPREPDRILFEAWGPLLTQAGKPLICLATAAQLTLIQRPVDPAGPPTIHSPDLLAWYNSLPGLPPARQIYLGPSLTSPFWGDVAGAFKASQVLISAGAIPEFLPESAMQLPALNKRNLLMFGRPGFSKSVDLFLRDKPFRVRIPDEQYSTVIWNVDPRAGEPAEYDARSTSRTENRETAFGLITVMPSGGDDSLRTVIFSATRSAGSQAASEFFSSSKQLRTLKSLFQKEGHSGFPASYQVVVRSNVFDTSALDVQYVTHRVISGPRK
jgi:hypothetical protein